MRLPENTVFTLIHLKQVSEWKRQVIESLSEIFAGGMRVDGRELRRQESELFEQIGRLKMELESLKKKYGALHSSQGES